MRPTPSSSSRSLTSRALTSRALTSRALTSRALTSRALAPRALALAPLALSCAALLGCPAPYGNGSTSAGATHSKNKGAISLVSKAKTNGTPIAEMDGLTLSVGDIEARLNGQSPFVRARFKDPKEKLKFVEQQMRVEVLAKEAIALGYHELPKVQEALKKIIVQKLTREKFDSAVRPQEITDEELKTYYEAHRDEYNKAEMIRLAQIYIAFGKDKNAALNRAKKIADEAKVENLLNDRKHFKDLVAKHSEDSESKKTGGDLRYLTALQLSKRFGDAVRDEAFSMTKINEVVGPVASAKGFHILKRTGHRKAIVRTLDQVKNPIRNVIYREKRSKNFDNYVEELKKKFHVKVHADKIDMVKLSAEAPRVKPMSRKPKAPQGEHGKGPRTK